jgi:hypothetical protein
MSSSLGTRIAISSVVNLLLQGIPCVGLTIFVLSDFDGGIRVSKEQWVAAIIAPPFIAIFQAVVLAKIAQRRLIKLFPNVVGACLGLLLSLVFSLVIGNRLDTRLGISSFAGYGIFLLVYLGMSILFGWFFSAILQNGV